MEIESEGGGESFYVVFCDLLFAVMAIFVLLMMIFMIQVSASASAAKEKGQQVEQAAEQAKQLAGQVAQLASQATATKRELDDIRSRLSKAMQEKVDAVKAADALKPKPTDLVIAIDGTGSMGQWLQQVQTTVQSAAGVATRLSPRFRIGLVIYRDRARTQLFPLTEIASKANGQDKGMVALDRFMNAVEFTYANNIENRGQTQVGTRMDPISSIADFPNALEAATSIFRKAPSTDSRKVLIIIGDVGPWELGDFTKYDEPIDREAKKTSLDLIKRFSASYDQVSLLAVFIDSEAPHRDISKQFFKEMAAVTAAGKGRYSEGMSTVALTVVEAVVRQ